MMQIRVSDVLVPNANSSSFFISLLFGLQHFITLTMAVRGFFYLQHITLDGQQYMIPILITLDLMNESCFFI